MDSETTATPGWREILLLVAADETGLLEAFRTPRSRADAAAACGLDPRATRIVADALAGFGHLRPAGDDALTLTARGLALVDAPEDADPMGTLMLDAREMAAQVHLAEVLRTGLPRDDMSAGDPAVRVRFMRAMRGVAAPRVPLTVAALPVPEGGGRLLDVGGAPGSYAIPLARAGWSVTVADLAETLEATAGLLAAEGVTAAAGDVTRALPEGPWDAVYLGNVVHLFGPEEARALVVRAGEALAPGGRLAVQEVATGLADTAPGFGVTMLMGTPAGEAYSRDDYARWMVEAGCPMHTVVAVQPGAHHLMIGTRA